MLVHQRAAFNSPVWFNIGVKVSRRRAAGSLAVTRGLSRGKIVGGGISTKGSNPALPGRREAQRAQAPPRCTGAGVTLDATGDHVVWRHRTGAGAGWVTADELEPGDQLEWHRSESPAISSTDRGGGLETSASRRRRQDVYDIQTEGGSTEQRTPGAQLLHPRGRRHKGIDPQLVRRRRQDLPPPAVRDRAEQPAEHPHVDGATQGRRDGDGSGEASCAAPTRRLERSSQGGRHGARRRWSSSMPITPTSKISSGARRSRSARRALQAAGFDMDLDGKDSHSIQYQNANNSVRVTDELHAGRRRRS